MKDKAKKQLLRKHAELGTNKKKHAGAGKAFFPEEGQTQKILDTLSEHVVYHDMEMSVLWANRAACRSVNLELEQVVGRHCYEIWAHRASPCDDCPVKLSYETGLPQSAENKTPDGRHWHIKCAPVFDTNGEMVAMVELTLDISERKKMEDALKKSEARYRCLVEISPHGIQEIDPEGYITFANPAHNKIYGYSDHEMIGKSIVELQASGSAKTELKAYLARLVNEQPEPTPYIGKNYTKDGRVIDVQVDWNYKRDDHGRVTGFISVVTDMTDKIRATKALLQAKDKLEQRVQKRTAELLETNAKLNQEIEERKQAEVKLRQQKNSLEALLETIPNPVFYKDAAGIYTGCNRAFEEFIGKSRLDIIGKTVYDLGPKEIADKYFEMDSALFEKPGKQHYEWKIKRTDGVFRDVIFDKATIADSAGKALGLVGVISDITERKQSEQALRKSESTLKAILAASPIGICLVRNRI